MADTHCHLDFDLFDGDREEVLERALAAGVDRILVPGIDLASSRAAVELAEKYHPIYAAVGVHPNETGSWEAGTPAALRELSDHPKVAAIGEIGLDYFRDRVPHEVQQRVFREQLSLAAELGLPVVIHNRLAAGDLLAILAQWQSELAEAGLPLAGRPGVLHSFSDSVEAAQQAIGLQFRIGLTGPVTFRNAPKLRQTVAQLSSEHLLIETDAPFLTPHPHRGKRNEPAYVRLIAEKISEILSLPSEVVAEETSANGDRLFNWRETA